MGKPRLIRSLGVALDFLQRLVSADRRDLVRGATRLKPLKLYRFCAGDHYAKGKSIRNVR